MLKGLFEEMKKMTSHNVVTVKASAAVAMAAALAPQI